MLAHVSVDAGTGANRALELIGRHNAVNAFKHVDKDDTPIDQSWEIKIVHTTKEEYEREMNRSRSQQARHH